MKDRRNFLAKERTIQITNNHATHYTNVKQTNTPNTENHIGGVMVGILAECGRA
jgi:hypothetical protein